MRGKHHLKQGRLLLVKLGIVSESWGRLYRSHTNLDIQCPLWQSALLVDVGDVNIVIIDDTESNAPHLVIEPSTEELVSLSERLKVLENLTLKKPVQI